MSRHLPARVERQLHRLIERCGDATPAPDRARGDVLFGQGRVTLFGGDALSLEAMVSSSDGVSDAFVTLDVPAHDTSAHEADAGCDCRRFADTGACAHLWATCRALEARLDAEGASARSWRRLFAQGATVDREAAAPRRGPAPPVFVGLETDLDERRQRQQSFQWPSESLLFLRLVTPTDAPHDGDGADGVDSADSADGPRPVRRLELPRQALGDIEPPELQALAAALLSFAEDPATATGGRGVHRLALPSALWPTLLPRLAALGRLGRLEPSRSSRGGAGASDREHLHLLRWDDGAPWRLELEVTRGADDGARLAGHLERAAAEDTERRDVRAAVAAFSSAVGDDLVCFAASIGCLEAHAASWIASLRRGPLEVPPGDVLEMLEQLHEQPRRPSLSLPDAWRWPEAHEPPVGLLRFTGALRHGRLQVELRMLYGDFEITVDDIRPRFVDPAGGRVLVRDRAAEQRLASELADLGIERDPFVFDDRALSAPATALTATLDAAFDAGWQVDVEGARVDRGVESLRLRTAIDWFDLEGVISFGDHEITLPELLEVLQSSRGSTLDLGGGRRGFLSPSARRRLGALVALALGEHDDALRFQPSQAMILDALLDARHSDTNRLAVDADEGFERLRRSLRRRGGVTPADEPPGFRGTLRAYQREGVGWMRWLDDVGLGGCLADDMGLGKTVQLLALLEGRREREHRTLIVVPRTLLETWRGEAARFTPDLRLAVYHGSQRRRLLGRLDAYDVLVTTYGTLRRDVQHLMEVDWHTVVLDEAQAIKNPRSQTAKAARLLPARQRLALTGTPVENHLGDLWSLFDFLTPGLLGRLPALDGAVGRAQLEPETLDAIARTLRPLILRRTKGEVLQDLPPKQEQTLLCELSGPERKRYDELRDHYRQALRPSLDGARGSAVAGSKILVLEALLRLRQAALHPELLLRRPTRAKSAKVGLLLDRLEEVIAEGHKALVFSQFVRLLDILEREIERRGWRYERLDGRTRHRQRRVERFQDDPEIRLFLISLKAGGTGLNLTAASYVFLLDPWWNPAIESQAIDRAHRIGQTEPVTAYRLIARDTVEEKIVELQQHKRALADAIVARDESLLKGLTVDDLDRLLG